MAKRRRVGWVRVGELALGYFMRVLGELSMVRDVMGETEIGMAGWRD